MDSDNSDHSDREGTPIFYDDDSQIVFPRLVRRSSRINNALIILNNASYLHEYNVWPYDAKRCAFDLWREKSDVSEKRAIICNDPVSHACFILLATFAVYCFVI